MEKGSHHTEETKRKLSNALKGKRIGKDNPFYGKKHTEEQRKKLSLACKDKVREKNHYWKGDDVGYSGLHNWVRNNKGKPIICVHCGTKKNVHWANISQEYKRDLDDWFSLCMSCHKYYDNNFKGIKRFKATKKRSMVKIYDI